MSGLRCSVAVAALALVLLGPARAQVAAELHHVDAPVGLARLVKPAGAVAPPLVIVLPDALGEDGRSEPYVDSLLARGIATLVLGLGEDLESNPSPVDPAASPEAVPPALAWAREAGFGPVGLLGFGLGGRAALASAAPLPLAALYPDCAGLVPAAPAPALILQGAAATARCRDLPPAPGIEVRVLADAGHGWDVPGALWPAGGPLLADPSGGAPLRTHPDLNVTLTAAEAVADWFEAWLLNPNRSASR